MKINSSKGLYFRIARHVNKKYAEKYCRFKLNINTDLLRRIHEETKKKRDSQKDN